MTKYFIYILFILLFTSCRQSKECKKFAAVDFQYSSYLWYQNQDSYQWEFYLANYLHVGSHGEFKLLRHTTFLDNPQYFSGTLNDSIQQIIDSVLLENNFHPEIKTDGLPDTPLLVYEGFTYLLDYKITGKTRTKIQYIKSSSRSPKNILNLTSLLDMIISKIQFKKIDSFSIGAYIDTLKKISYYNLPLPKYVKFIPPKTNHIN